MDFKRPKLPTGWLRWSLCALVVFVPVLLMCLRGLDPDFGWHLQAGNYIRAHGIPSHDVFSYTASNFRWIDHEWGSDVLLSYIYGLGGYTLAAVLTAIIWSAGLLLAAGRRANPFILFAAVVAVSPFIAIRPTAVTALFFALTLVVLRRQQSKLYWFLPLLFIIWANMHAGFISGLALVGYFMLRRRSKRLAIILGLCLAATLCNVYGIRIYEEVIRTIFSKELHSTIQEWRSFNISKVSLIYVLFWGAGFWLYQKPFFKRWLGLGPILLLAAISANRNVPLLVLATLQDFTAYFREAAASIPKHLKGLRRAAVVALVAGLLGVLGYGTHLALNNYRGNQARNYPLAAVAYLQQHPCSGHMYNNYNYGGYLIWKLPQSKDYIDGRMPTWEPYMSTYIKLENHPKANYKAEFAKYNIQCALLTNGADNMFITALKQADWKVVSRANGAVLLLSPQAEAADTK